MNHRCRLPVVIGLLGRFFLLRSRFHAELGRWRARLLVTAMTLLLGLVDGGVCLVQVCHEHLDSLGLVLHQIQQFVLLGDQWLDRSVDRGLSPERQHVAEESLVLLKDSVDVLELE